jgi:endo-1,4-beta-xylanase
MLRFNRMVCTALAALSAVVTTGMSLSAAPPVADSPAVTLRQAAGSRFLVGTAIMSYQLDDPRLAAFIASQFNCLTGENEFKAQSLEPQPGQFDFNAADKIVAFAQQHDMKIVGHNLCWHNQIPAWMFQDENKQPLPREKALANLKNHIDGVLEHFKGKVFAWDVVNEAISDTGSEYLRPTPALKAIGDDYIAKAFEFAHAADPGVKLIYNDYSIENPDKRDKTVRLLRDLKAKGAHIDEVGIQGHYILKLPGAIDALDKAITAFSAEGVKVAITELDVEVLPRKETGADITATEKSGVDPYTGALPADIAQAQADFYRRLFQVLLKHPGIVTRVTFWGPHDGTSWLNNWPVRSRTNHPLLFDRDLQPKPAFTAVVDLLKAQ